MTLGSRKRTDQVVSTQDCWFFFTTEIEWTEESKIGLSINTTNGAFLYFSSLPNRSAFQIYFESWRANMKFSLSLTQFLCSILFLLHFHTTISSSFSSNHSSSNHLCAHHQSLSLLQFKQSFPIHSSGNKVMERRYRLLLVGWGHLWYENRASHWTEPLLQHALWHPPFQ